MNQLYTIQCQAPPTDGRVMCPVQVNLAPEWKDAVARYLINDQPMNQTHVNGVVESMHRCWLDGCGWSGWFDPDNYGFDMDKNKPRGPKACKAYGPHDIRIAWGEWGPEHITIPGDACGLDLERSIGAFRGGMSLLPHNVDTIRQAYLLLVIFTWFGDAIVLNEELLERETRKKDAKL